MPAEPLNPARITLNGLALLENRRAVLGKPYSFIYDASFTCMDTVTDGIGSFRCFVGRDKTKKQDDLYEIRTKVRYHPHNNNL